MPACVVAGCSNRCDRSVKSNGITFHSFPRNPARCALWVNAVGRKEWTPSRYSKICSKHFRDEDIDRTSLSVVRIRENAVPSIFPTVRHHLQENERMRIPLAPLPTEQQIAAISIHSRVYNESDTEVTFPCASNKTDEDGVVIKTLERDVPQSVSALPPYLQENEENRPPTQQQVVAVSVAGADTQASCSAGNDSPCVGVTPNEESVLVRSLKRHVSDLSSKNELLRKKIKVLQQSKRRLKKKVSSMSVVINELRKNNLVFESGLSVLENIPGMNKYLLQRQAAKANCGSLPKAYKPELRAFALTLHFYSPRAYKYVRRSFNTCLPHPRTLARWYQCVGGEPGFTTEAFNLIRARSQGSDNVTLCSLIVDEIAIRQHIEFDGDQYYGYVNMRSSIAMDSLPVAKEAFVLMLVAINGSWKLPVGYFLTSGITGEQKANLIQQCISLATASGVRVVCLCCDGCASNLAMAKCLGCRLDPHDLKTTFFVEGVSCEVTFLLDPPHMLKLIRNTLGEKKHIWDDQGEVISWLFFELLNKVQIREGLHIGNKITSSHINFIQNKMKVRLAAQLLSNSVADAMQYCSEMEIPGFDDASATVRFIRIFNRLFDVLNSRNLVQNQWKQPLRVHNFIVVERFLLDAADYIKALTLSPVVSGTKLVDSNRKTGFVGFLICISSVLHLYRQLVEPQTAPLLKFLPTYKCSQDHLEMFFSAIRSHGGWNNNPTARQFMSAYKRLLVHNEVRESEKGNCVPLEDIPIMTYNGQSIEEHINVTTGRSQLADTESHLVTHDHDYVEAGVFLSEVAAHIVVYIAGFVVRHLERVLKCESCLSVLRGDGSHTFYALIHRKNRGGLVLPSNDVVDICLSAEKTFRKYSAGNLKIEKHTFSKCVSEVLAMFLFRPVFTDLADHMKDQDPLDNHVLLLIKAVAKKYLLIRHKHSAKCVSDGLHARKLRAEYTKIVLFKGQ